MSIPLDLWGEDETRKALENIDRDPRIVRQLQELFCEGAHLFNCHPEGVWSQPDGYKDSCAKDLAEILKTHTGLVGRLLKTENRVIKMLTYRAVEMNKAGVATMRGS